MNSNLTHFSVQVLEGKPPHSMSNIRGVIKYINENSRVAKHYSEKAESVLWHV